MDEEDVNMSTTPEQGQTSFNAPAYGSTQVRYASNCTFNNQSNQVSMEEQCLQSLYFPNMLRKDNAKPRANDTSAWILSAKDYMNWEKEGGILWLRGRAGSGKSMLMDYIIQNNKTKKRNQLHLSYAASKRFGGLRSSAVGLIRSLLHQLLEDGPTELSKFLKETEFEKKLRLRGKPGRDWEWDISDLEEMLVTCLESTLQNTAVIISLDAMDEILDGLGTTALRMLRRICNVNGNGSSLSVCFSSRPSVELDEYHDFRVDVEFANGSDVKALVSRELAPLQDKIDQATYDQALKETTQRAGGILLWVTAMGPRLVRRLKLQEIDMRQTFKGCPAELETVYHQKLSDIEPEDLDMAFSVFKWICLSLEALTDYELQAAVSISHCPRLETREAVEQSKLWIADVDAFIDHIEDISSGLLRGANVKDGFQQRRDVHRVQFLCDHASVQDFMVEKGLNQLGTRLTEEHSQLSSAESHLNMACECLHLLLDRWTNSDPERDETNKRRPNFTSFDPYAAKHWMTHLQEADKNHIKPEAMMKALTTHTSEQWYRIRKGHPVSGEGTFVSPLHVLCGLGLRNTLLALLNDSCGHSELPGADQVEDWLNLGNENNWTPLDLAAECGNIDVVDRLIDFGAVIDTAIGEGPTTLHLAASSGNINAMKCLLRHPAVDVNCRDELGQTPISIAVESGHVHAVKYLLREHKTGHLVHRWQTAYKTFSGKKKTPLVHAVRRGDVEMTELLLTCEEIDADTSCSLGYRTIFHEEIGRPSLIVPLLVNSGKFEVEGALSYAAHMGKLDVVDALLKTGKVNVDEKDINDKSVLTTAIEGVKPSLKLVQRLLATGRFNVSYCKRPAYSALAVAQRKHRQYKDILDWVAAHVENKPSDVVEKDAPFQGHGSMDEFVEH